MPDTPPPITRASWFIPRLIPFSGSRREALDTAILIRSLDFSVAFSGSFWCTHEHWSLILAISNRFAFSPASFKVSWNMGS